MNDPNPHGDPATFLEVLSGPALEPSPYHSFAHLLFEGPNDDPSPVILGSIDQRMVNISIGSLRNTTIALIPKLESLGIEPGQTVCLLRLPRTSETLIAATYVALSAWGVRVFLPMFADLRNMAQWLTVSDSRMVLWSEQEVGRSEVESDRELIDSLSREVTSVRVPSYCLERDLDLPSLLSSEANQPRDEPFVTSLLQNRGPEDPCLLLTTSGTSGRTKMVLYKAGSFLRSCTAWSQAGLFDENRLGGRGLCLLLAHSMGIRALWNAIWCRSPLCLIPPEWFVEHTERAKHFLAHMRPEHVTGGPAVFRTLIELARVFPRVKQECLGSLRCAVSSGAPFDPTLAAKLRTAIDLSVHNALGLTETQQVASTVMPGPFSSEGPSLGNLLPGVRIGFASNNQTSRLFIASPFGAEGYLEDDGLHPLPGPPGWFDTGDIVERTPRGLRYVAREGADFFKDGFGVKIHRARVMELHADLQSPIAHLEPFPLRDEPGLGALVFVGRGMCTTTNSVLTEQAVVKRVRDLLSARLDRLRDELEETEFRHLTITRFVCIGDDPPKTPKGQVSRTEILTKFEPLISSMSGRYVHGPGRDRLPRDAWVRRRSIRLTSPRRGALLRIARLDKDFIAARGDTLTYRHHGKDIDVIDLVGGFGGNLLGHRHPIIRQAIQTFLDGARPPIGDQGSAQTPAGRLAQSLSRVVAKSTGNAYVVRFGSTGSEAVEMAIAHAQLERMVRLEKHHRTLRQTCGARDPEGVRRCIEESLHIMNEQRPRLLVLSSSFHGHSLGARSALGSTKNRLPYTLLSRIDPITIGVDCSTEALLDVMDRFRFDVPSLTLRDGDIHASSFPCSSVVAALVEPVLGEGGVRIVPVELMKLLGAQVFPLILDEIQCGLGRTGNFLASEGVRGHYYLFAKSLGGGFAKISALLIEQHRYVEKFDEHYASTFASDALSSALGTVVLDVIEQEDIPGRARERGFRLAKSIEAVQLAYPDVFGPLRGRGLMLGVEILSGSVQDSLFLRGAVQYEYLGVLVASALFHRHGIRILPTLSAPNTLRIEPSAYLGDDGMVQLEEALRWLGSVLRKQDVASLVEHLVEDEQDVAESLPEEFGPPILVQLEPPKEKAARVGFINHFVHPERELALLDTSLARLSPLKRQALFYRFMELFDFDPLIVFGRNILQDRVWFLSVANALDAATFETLHRSQDRARTIERVQRAVDLAAAKGCSIIALGAYSSIITGNGAAIIPPPNTVVTSGNTLTVAMAARRILHACEQCDIDTSDPNVTLGIVGATGNIGKALSNRLLLGPKAFSHAILLSRTPEHFGPLQRTLGSHLDITYSSDLSLLRRCHVIALAVNTNEPLILPHQLGSHRTVIGDVSVPGSVSAAVRKSEQVHFISLAGVMKVPGEPDFVMSSHSPPGTAFCCAVEAMLLGLEPELARSLTLLGNIDPVAVEALDTLASKHAWLDPISGKQEKA